MRLLNFGYSCGVFAALLLGASLSLRAETATDWVRTDQSKLRLISAVEGVKSLESLRVGLQIKLAPGWKTYWRSPGDAGIPPLLDWSGSENMISAEVLWPLPEEFDAYGFSSWGYHDEVVFPIDITLQEPGNPLDLKLRLQLGICEDVCIPYELEFTLTLDTKSAETTGDASIIEAFSRRVPEKIGSETAVLTQVMASSKDDRLFAVTATSTLPLNKPSIIVEGEDGTYFDLVSASLSADRRHVAFELEGHLPAKSDRISGQDITVTIFDGSVAGEADLRIE